MRPDVDHLREAVDDGEDCVQTIGGAGKLDDAVDGDGLLAAVGDRQRVEEAAGGLVESFVALASVAGRCECSGGRRR